MAGPQSHKYTAERTESLLTVPLDAMTLIYQRRSGITHIVAEPVPEILAVMGDDALTTTEVAARLSVQFDFGGVDAEAIITVRLEELAALGLVERIRA